MSTLEASVWLLLRENADTEVILSKYESVYEQGQRCEYLWLLLYYAVQAAHTDLVLALLNDAYLKKRLDLEQKSGNLLNSKELTTCLNEAIRKENINMIEIMLSKEPELINTKGNLFLPTAQRFKLVYTPFELAIHKDSVLVLKTLLRVDGSWLTGDSQNPLHLAVILHASNSIKYFLSLESAHLYINSKDAEGRTPLLLAAMHQPDVIPLLLDHGADVTITCHQQDALQLLSNGSIRERPTTPSEVDPVPTLESMHQRAVSNRSFASNEDVYITINFVELAKNLIEKGLDINNENDPPLQIFCKNVRRKLQDLLDDAEVRTVYTSAVSYLATISNQSIKDEALLNLCHQIYFIAIQVRRSSDYDNIVQHVNLLDFIKELIFILLGCGANPEILEPSERGAKAVTAMGYLLPATLPCVKPLKQVLTAELLKDQPVSDATTAYNTALDILLISPLALFPLQQDEPELYQQGFNAIGQVVAACCKLGGKCHQPLRFFIVLCLDPVSHMELLDVYLNCQCQADYHSMLSTLMRLSTHEAVVDATNSLLPVQQVLLPQLSRIHSLKDLLRRDIVHYLGGQKCAQKVQHLPIPGTLKQYILAFWEKEC